MSADNLKCEHDLGANSDKLFDSSIQFVHSIRSMVILAYVPLADSLEHLCGWWKNTRSFEDANIPISLFSCIPPPVLVPVCTCADALSTGIVIHTCTRG